MKDQKVSFLPLFLIIIQPAFMSSYLAISRGASGYVPPISLAFWRWLFAFLLLLPFVFYKIKKNWKQILNEWKKLLFLGFTGFCLCGIFPAISGTTTTVTNMGIIYSASPIFIILFSFFLFKEKITYYQVIATFICLLGVFIVLSKGKIDNLLGFKFNIGDIWISGAMLSWAIYSVYLMNFKSNFDLITRFTLMGFFGILCLIPIYFIESYYYPVSNFDENFLKWSLLAAVFPGIIAFLMYSKLQKLIGASLTGLTVYLIPIYTSFYGYFFFKEQINLYHWIGGGLVILGIILANKNLFKIK
ncbi:MAG: DMT family transporter [Proteobacteria bacterium]|nr:DMT family transporter [Candidatus Fonsibacter sp. PEL5]